MTELREKLLLPATKRETLYLVLIFAALAAIAAMLLLRPRTDAAATAEPPALSAEPTIITREVEKLVEVEKAVTVEALEQGLRDMGTLIAEEYYFTDLISFSSVKKFMETDFVLPFTESSYLVSYDGVVSAGVDLSAARVEKDDAQMRVTVYLPAAAVHATVIDLDSFCLREEKTGIGNHISVRDFNSSLQELEKKAGEDAVARGLLEKADENARNVAARFIGSLIDTSAYALEFAAVGPNG